MTDKSNTTENTKPAGIRRSKNLRMLTLSMIILLAGIVIGSAGTTLVIQKNSRKKPSPNVALIIARGIKDRLDLTDVQFEKIQPIIKTTMDKLREYKEQARPKIEAVVNQMREQISDLLTDDQREKWESQIKDFERRHRMHRGRGEGRGPRDGRGPGGPRGMGPGSEGRRPGRGMGPGGPGRGPGGGRGYGPGGSRGPGRDPNGLRIQPPKDPNEPE